LANFICVLFGTKESYFDSKFKFLLIRTYQENTLRKDGLCSKIKLLLAKIGFTHAWMNQGTFSKPKLLHSLSIKLEDRYINHWKTLLFNDDNKNGGDKQRTYRKLKK
jgi:hypothetical protein